MLISLDKQTDNQIKQAIRRVEADLINGNFEKLVSENKSLLTVGVIENLLNEYKDDYKIPQNAKITPAPDYVFDNLEIFEMKDLIPPTYHVDYLLWMNGKQSDLTLQVEIVPTIDTTNVTVEDLHVM